MREFRAYTLNCEGNLMSRVDLLCETEEDAKLRTERMVDGAP